MGVPPVALGPCSRQNGLDCNPSLVLEADHIQQTSPRRTKRTNEEVHPRGAGDNAEENARESLTDLITT